MAGPRIHAVPVEVDTRWPGGRTNAYLIEGSPNLLVDPPAIDPALTRSVERHGVGAIAVTHTHSDHIGGVAHYADECGATVWARAGRLDRFVKTVGRYPDQTFREGTALGPASVLETPGHAPDHVAFRVGNQALVGDLAVRNGSVVIGGDDGDLRAYLVSLRRLRQQALDRLYPGHGPPIDAPTDTMDRLLFHRLDREQQVLEAVEAGARELEAITEAAYEKDLTGVRDLARATVAAHLRKLAVEGHVDWNGHRAVPVVSA